MTGDEVRAFSHYLIGTAGWSIPKAAQDAFPQDSSHLARYAAVLTAAEINSSFHRPHQRSVYEKWAASVPPGFRFSVKLPKEISHKRKLVDCDEPLAAFIEQIGGLGEKLGVALLQLPPSLAFAPDTASSFLTDLRGRTGPSVGIACEPRHASWFTAEANACLTDCRIARVVADPVIVPPGLEPGGWTGLVYRRLHGSPRMYYSAYEPARLQALAQAMTDDQPAQSQSWCIFDNTASGAATIDALALQTVLATTI